MRSKTSSFNFTLFWKTVTRFWPIWFFCFAAWFLLLPLTLNAGNSLDALRAKGNILSMMHTAGVIIGFLAAIASATAVWSFLYSARSVSGTACLPIRREGVFWSVTLAGIAPMLAVNLVIALLSIAISALRGANCAGAVAQWFGGTALQLLFFYGFATLCAQLTGNLVVLPVVCTVLNFVAVVVELVVREILTVFLYGLSSGSDFSLTFLSPAVEMMASTGTQSVTRPNAEGVYEILDHCFQGWGTLGIYAAVGLVCVLAALLLYRRRAMETAGDVVAIKVLKPVFKYCMTFGCALVLGKLMFSVAGLDGAALRQLPLLLLQLLMMLLGAFVGYFASEMLIRKSFHVWRGAWRGLGVSVLAIAALLFAAEFDLVGYERRTPAADSVKSVFLSTGGDAVMLEEPGSIEAVLELHREIISNKAYNEDPALLSRASRSMEAETRQFELNLRYQLENGSLITRSYSLPYEAQEPARSDLPALQELMNCPEAIADRKQTPFALDADAIFSATVSAVVPEALLKEYQDDAMESWADTEADVPVGELVWSLSAEEAAELYYDCIVPDMEDSSLGRIWFITDERYAQDVCSARISIDARIPNPNADAQDADPYVYHYFSTVPTTSAARTCAWLAAHGIPLYTIAEVGDYN